MTEVVQFDGEKPDESLVGSYVPYVPPMVKMISASNSRPPLLKCAEGERMLAAYEIDKMPFSFVPRLVIQEISGEWTIETPLELCHYLKPDDKSKYNIDVCAEVSIENAKREQHNKFLIDILRIFMKRNDCGVSGGLITLPPMPPDPIEARLSAIRKLTEDKLDTAKRAIEYCVQYGFYCGRDYEFDKAMQKANDVCYDETIKARTGEGKRVRVRLEGRPPSWWDGISETDSSGKRVMWKRGEGHTFLTPNVIVVEDTTDEPTCTEIISTTKSPTAATISRDSNPFEKIFSNKKEDEQLPTIPRAVSPFNPEEILDDFYEPTPSQ